MGAPMVEMRKCTSDLVKTWGLDPAQQDLLEYMPMLRTSPGSWLRASDYPRNLAMMGEQAIIRFRLLVDGEGKPTTCKIQTAIGDKTFADTTCRLIMQRARFEPARATDGAAVASYYVNSVRWIMRQ